MSLDRFSAASIATVATAAVEFLSLELRRAILEACERNICCTTAVEVSCCNELQF